MQNVQVLIILIFYYGLVISNSNIFKCIKQLYIFNNILIIYKKNKYADADYFFY